MKYITAHTISQKEFIKEPFKIYDSIDNILIDFQNAKKFYVVEVEEDISFLKKSLYNLNVSRNKAFKNYYVDSEQKLIKLVNKVPITNLLKNKYATSEYFYSYIEANANELQQEHSVNALNKIVNFLINNPNPKNRIEPNILISLCIKLQHLPQESMDLIEEYITNNPCSTDMLVQFANNMENCDVNKIVKAIAKNDNSTHCLELFGALKKITNKKLSLDDIEDIIIEKDKKGTLIYELANKYNSTCNIDKLSKALDKVDKYGYISFIFATNIKGANKEFFQKSIIEKDLRGNYCIGLASKEGFNNELLLDKVIELDPGNCSMVIDFVKKATVCNLDKALEYILKHDTSGKYIIEFSDITNGYNAEKIVEHICDTDKEGKLAFLFALTIPNCNTSKIKDKIKEINNPELFCNLFNNNLNTKNKYFYLSQIEKLDDSGEIIKLIIKNNMQKLTEPDLDTLNNALNAKQIS